MTTEATRTDTQAAIDAGAAQMDIRRRISEVDGVPVAISIDGEQVGVEVLQDVLDAKAAQAPQPHRKVGVAIHHDLDSFILHINRNKTPTSTIWANVKTDRIEAVYDFHGPTGEPAGWGKHRAQYVMPKSPEWLAWSSKAGETMTQEGFALLLESRMDDMVPGDGLMAPVDMLTMARSLQIYTKGTFVKKIDQTTGQYTLQCKEEHTEESTKIPKAFGLALRVYDGGAQYRVEARIQFRVNRGAPTFEFTLHRADELVLDAFRDVRVRLAAETDLPGFAGTPE